MLTVFLLHRPLGFMDSGLTLVVSVQDFLSNFFIVEWEAAMLAQCRLKTHSPDCAFGILSENIFEGEFASCPAGRMFSFPVSCTELQCVAWHPPLHRQWMCRALCCHLQSRAGSEESTAPLGRGLVRSVPTEFAGPRLVGSVHVQTLLLSLVQLVFLS